MRMRGSEDRRSEETQIRGLTLEPRLAGTLPLRYFQQSSGWCAQASARRVTPPSTSLGGPHLSRLALDRFGVSVRKIRRGRDHRQPILILDCVQGGQSPLKIWKLE